MIFVLANSITYLINFQCELIAKMKETFVLIKCESGYETDVIGDLQKIEQIREIRRVIGEYDLLVKFEIPIESDASEKAIKKILDVDKVRSISSLAPVVRDI